MDKAKIQGIVSDEGALEKIIFQHAKHMGACVIVRGTTVTSTVITTIESSDFYVLVTALTPSTSKTSVTVSFKEWKAKPDAEKRGMISKPTSDLPTTTTNKRKPSDWKERDMR